MKRCGFPKPRSDFTLMEMLIVIAIVIVLAAIAIPTFSGVTKRARRPFA